MLFIVFRESIVDICLEKSGNVTQCHPGAVRKYLCSREKEVCRKMKLAVRKHDIELCSPARLVSGSVNILRCEFSFDEAWEGYVRTAVFASLDGAWAVPLVEDAAVVPWEALEAGRRLRIGVYGVCGDKRLPTVYTEPIFVERGAEEGDASGEPSPDKWTQLLEAIEQGLLKGDPGYSPGISVEPVAGGHRITVTSENGSESFDVLDGDSCELPPVSAADNGKFLRVNGGAWSAVELDAAEEVGF